jgi:hypothetical protein
MRICLLALLLSACASRATPAVSSSRVNNPVDDERMEMLTPASRTVVVARLGPPTSASGNGQRRILRGAVRE